MTVSDIVAAKAEAVTVYKLVAETPEQIYILCGHLDSISENPMVDAPGANDNASGTAIVLAAVMRSGPRIGAR